jgi:CRISPR-associated endoribonuclease Cas6
VDIWWLNLKVEPLSLCQGDHEESGDASLAELYRTENRQMDKHIRINFVSPTAFRSDGVNLPLPLPGMVYRSCWRKWNEYSGLPIKTNWLVIIDHCIQVTRLKNVNTYECVFAEGARGKTNGFTGQVEYSLNDSACRQYGIAPQDALEVFNTLSVLCSIRAPGEKTSWGMGQVRPEIDMGMAG